VGRCGPEAVTPAGAAGWRPGNLGSWRSEGRAPPGSVPEVLAVPPEWPGARRSGAGHGGAAMGRARRAVAGARGGAWQGPTAGRATNASGATVANPLCASQCQWMLASRELLFKRIIVTPSRAKRRPHSSLLTLLVSSFPRGSREA
jgi:hypothetical protein